jgi:zinc/manganese transport system substrate-binding protein
MILIIVAIMVPAIAVAGCGDDEDGGPSVLATNGVVGSIAERIGGEDVEIERLVPDGADPHDFQLSAEDRQALAEADLVLANGASLEEGIPLEDAGGAVFELADHAGELRPGDPHVWMDPSRVAMAVPAIADALAEADPAHADAYRRRAASYADELAELDRFVADKIERIPSSRRKLVTSHDALGYFADRYGLEVTASPFGPLGAEAEPSADALQDAIDEVAESGVPAVFAQAEDDPSVMQRIADETGVEVVDGLLVESPGEAGTYERMIEVDAELIATALGRD